MIRRDDYREMEVLVNGNWEKKDVLKALSDGTCLYLMGDKNSAGTYMAGACVPGQSVREIKTTKTVVKSAPEIMKILIENNYTVNEDGDWTIGSLLFGFTTDMWQYCGSTPEDSYAWEAEWLEEVEDIPSLPTVDENAVDLDELEQHATFR